MLQLLLAQIDLILYIKDHQHKNPACYPAMILLNVCNLLYLRSLRINKDIITVDILEGIPRNKVTGGGIV